MDPEVKVETPVTEGEGSQEPQYTPVQLKAIEQGWIPKEEFDGDEESFIDAAEFVRRGELFKKIETQSREIKQVRQALEALAKHNTRIKEVEYQRALKSLKDARKQAIIDGEGERAIALEEKIDEVQLERAAIAQEAQQIEIQDDSYTEQFQEWVDRNDWYESNKTMRATADALGKEFHAAGNSPAQVLKMVEAEIKKEFKHKFESPSAKRGTAVESSTRSGGSKRDSFTMSEDETRMMRKIVATGVMTEAQYKEQLKAIR
jgi:hypothetical protein